MAGEQKRKEREQEDPLMPTNIDASAPLSGPEKVDDLSDYELRQKLQIYQKIGEARDGGLVFQRLKNEYQNEMQKRLDTRTRQDINHRSGIMKGVHPANQNRIDQGREMDDQRLRDETANDAKTHYDQSHGLNQHFPKEGAKEKTRMKDVFAGKGRDRSLDKDH